MSQEIVSEVHQRHIRALTVAALLNRASQACIPAGIIFGFLALMSTFPPVRNPHDEIPVPDTRAAFVYVAAAALFFGVGHYVFRFLSRSAAKHVND